MKTFTVITLIVNIISLLLICTLIETDLQAAAGWGVIATFFSIVYFGSLLASGRINKKEVK